MSDKKQLHVIVAGEANTGKSTVGNLLVKAFREMGFLAEYQGEQVLSEDDIEKRLVGLVGKIDKVVIHEMQLQRGDALHNFLSTSRLPSAATGHLMVGAGLRHTPVINDRVWVIKSWTPDRDVTGVEIHSGVSRVFRQEELGDYEIVPAVGMGVLMPLPDPIPEPPKEYPPEVREQIKYVEDTIRESLKGKFLGQHTEDEINPDHLPCPHARPDFRMCPHCMGINDLPPSEPVTMECPSCHQQASMLISGQCAGCFGKVTR